MPKGRSGGNESHCRKGRGAQRAGRKGTGSCKSVQIDGLDWPEDNIRTSEEIAMFAMRVSFIRVSLLIYFAGITLASKAVEAQEVAVTSGLQGTPAIFNSARDY